MSVNRLCDTVFHIAAGDNVRCFADARLAVCHGDAQPRHLQHGQIVFAVTDGDDVGQRAADVYKRQDLNS